MLEPFRLVLKDIRVVDFSWVMAGPFATKMLGAMGAEVIKIETGTRPEYLRRGSWFHILNNSKLSCTIDITRSAGQDLVRRLIAESDVVVENFSAGVLPKFGLGQEELREMKPDLIFVSASGVGRSGPQKDALAYGTLIQGYSGRAGMIGEPNADLEAMGILPAWTDPMTAFWEALAILAAIYHRRRTGEGAFIDLSMLESTVALLPESLIRAQIGDDRTLGGNMEAGAAPAGCFRCAGNDDWLALAVRSDGEWAELCMLIGRPSLVEDERFANRAARESHLEQVNDIVASWVSTLKAGDAEALLATRGIAAARSRSIGDIIEDPGIKRRGLFPVLGNNLHTVALPWMDAEGWRGDIRETPALGADNADVFSRILGLSDAEIGALVEIGAIR